MLFSAIMPSVFIGWINKLIHLNEKFYQKIWLYDGHTIWISVKNMKTKLLSIKIFMEKFFAL